jgi:hypothetical protein
VDGRKRAEDVVRPGARPPPPQRRDRSANHQRTPLRYVISLGLLGVALVCVYQASTLRPSSSDGALLAVPQPTAAPEPQFKCDGRTHCSQMTSCAEATYFLRHCPGTQMDGNNDGEPCEQQWCN